MKKVYYKVFICLFILISQKSLGTESFYTLFADEKRYSDIIQISLSKMASGDCRENCQRIWSHNASVASVYIGDFESAYFYLKLSNFNSKNKMSREYYFKTYIIDLFADSRYALEKVAKNNLLKTNDKKRLETAYYLVGRDRHEKVSFEKVREYFANSGHSQKRTVADHYYSSQDHFYSPLLAGSLSLIPGAGFCYLGMYQTGLISFFLTGLTGLAAYELSQDGNSGGAVAAGMLSSVFYIGGIISSAHSASSMNDRSISKDREQLLEFLLPELSFYF